MGKGVRREYRFASETETRRFAAKLAPMLGAGDTILLYGGLGAGKTHFARSLIQTRLAAQGWVEEVPSPTFTLVQTYWDGIVELWHADLYRLTSPDEAVELGLDEASESAVCLVEWPDRMAEDLPDGALSLEFRMTDDPGERIVQAVSDDARWAELLDGADG